jgi:hypothetical protein
MDPDHEKLYKRRRVSEQKAQFAFKPNAFETAIAIHIFNMFATAINGKLIEVFWLNAKHTLKGIGLYSTKIGAIFIDLAFAGALVKVNAPAVWPHHTQVEGKLWRGEIVRKVGAIARVELATSSAVFDAMPRGHDVSYTERTGKKIALPFV